jgi:hypothetical protein
MIRELTFTDVEYLLLAMRWTIALTALALAGGGLIGLIVSIICAIVLLFLYEIIRSKTAKR